MIFRKCIFIAFYFFIQIVIGENNLDEFGEDYFFGEMRTKESKEGYSCHDITTLKKCNEKCEDLLGICYKKECYCVVKYNSDSATYTKPRKGEKLETIPSRRHHIAHFCPNLEVARTCIRKCQKEGKPAFCGKDHVCYCSHRYDGRNPHDKINATAVRIAFYDLYEKYFGPQYEVAKEMFTSSEAKKPDENSNNEDNDDDFEDLVEVERTRIMI